MNIKEKEVPSYAGKDAAILNGDKPLFTKEQKDSTESVKEISQLDNQGRTGVVFANIGSDTLRSVGDRKTTPSIEPSGWNQSKYGGLLILSRRIFLIDVICLHMFQCLLL